MRPLSWGFINRTLGIMLLVASPGTIHAADVINTKLLPGVLLDDAVAEQTGPWQLSVHSKPFVGKGYVHSGKSDDPASTEPKRITFRRKLPTSGTYHVYLAYNAGENRARQAPVVIQHAGGEAQLKLNQREEPKGPLTFHPLGKFEFSAEAEAVVTIADTEAEGIVVVDAVLFVPQDKVAKLKGLEKKLLEPEQETAPEFVRAQRQNTQTLTPETLDELIVRDAHLTKTTALIDDETFLRRATIDVIGRIPTEQERTDFLKDTNPAKRALLVDRLLASPEFGQNWATYWSDVFSYRIPQPELTYLDYQVFQDWLAEQLNEGTGWDEVTYRILTATGKVGDNPPAFFVGYHQASTSRLAGETTRIFLGTQIQCAECHDHPFVDIPQERFHQMAAFFVRSSSQLPWNDSSEIIVSSKASGEHKLPETSRVMLPTVFSGDPLPKGSSDVERRVQLAKWVTSPDNAMFTKAYANRIWERLMDSPFCDPIDEITAEAGYPSLPSIHDAVAAHFAANDYDGKSLFRLILNTKAYQRQLDANDQVVGQLASAEFRKMRGDVVFKSLAVAIDLPNVEGEATEPTAAVRFPPPPKSTLDLVNEVFGYDPSLGKDFRPQTMQQAMFMMNNRQLQAQVNAAADQKTKLAKLLEQSPDDRQAIQRLYVNVLGRAPSEDELEVAYDYVQEIDSRSEAFEDLLWALLNTAEFTTRR
ncbi:DUF1549 domain-containing protein [Blastopirellula marina]|uniref:Xanthan lyase n=1 Tax=Blastopirellula marina TaxID=124 RepID=A0A2S8FHF3_9BACT|nr:DUF1549 domain-containing protein [Blastopirellula marina]PQO31586.1 hypothetical protein C5Y98_19410 [Blastopirellula marina]PTL42893.1 DUF1549 domain-containing protein [Blastopirellula marina]